MINWGDEEDYWLGKKGIDELQAVQAARDLADDMYEMMRFYSLWLFHELKRLDLDYTEEEIKRDIQEWGEVAADVAANLDYETYTERQEDILEYLEWRRRVKGRRNPPQTESAQDLWNKIESWDLLALQGFMRRTMPSDIPKPMYEEDARDEIMTYWHGDDWMNDVAGDW